MLKSCTEYNIDFCSQENRFSTVKKNVIDQENFLESRKFAMIEEAFHSKQNFKKHEMHACR